MTLENPAAGRTWRRLAGGELSWETLRLRSRILHRIRSFFRERGFLEVDPPIALPYPNIDPNVFPVTISDAAGRASPLFLHTSPELSMKKLLAAGSGNIFFLGKVFRDREGSPLHHPEFTMLEWYRVGEPCDAVMRDVEELVRELSREFAGKEEIRRGGESVPVSGKWPRWELRDAFAELLQVSMTDRAGLRSALGQKGIRPGESEGWDDLFFRAYIDVIEPALEGKGAVFLSGFPSALAAMAKRRDGDAELCERFEGYLCGVELVNGYEELTDAREQADRLRDLAARHEHQTKTMLPIDPEFLEALFHGLPPCCGAALGVDRLAMLLLGKESIADVTIR
ncbi:MAG: EF-P lysine aminoacylase GenX [Deltaproteobacteria bacterium]|nr:EF-P lysine aminoacylase GenX [Deltaproteobacteria bacterium]